MTGAPLTGQAGRATPRVTKASRPSGDHPSRMEMVKFYSELSPDELRKRIADYDAEGIIFGYFPIRRFKDGDNLGLPRWARSLVIGSFAEQGWAAYDQKQGGKKVASGKWGDSLYRLRGGRITSREHRYYSGILIDALAIAMEAATAGETQSGSTRSATARVRKDIAQIPSPNLSQGDTP
jgi:hypothetical protein